MDAAGASQEVEVITVGNITLSQRQLVELANLAATACLLFVWPFNCSWCLSEERRNTKLTTFTTESPWHSTVTGFGRCILTGGKEAG